MLAAATVAPATRRAVYPIDVNSQGLPANSPALNPPSISGNSRFVAFSTTATDVSPLDERPNTDVFVRDVGRRTTVLISRSHTGDASANGDSFGQVLSRDGRAVAFMSEASDLVEGDTNDADDVFVSDLDGRDVRLVSLNAARTGPGDGPSYGPVSISADGRSVAFRSEARDLVADLDDATVGLYLHDLRRQRTTRLGDADVNPPSKELGTLRVSFSRNGRYVAFATIAAEGFPANPRGVPDVFVRDLEAGTTALVSVAFDGSGAGDGQSVAPSISEDGRSVAFFSHATNLVAHDGNGAPDVFLRDLRRGRTVLVSANASGSGAGDGDSYIMATGAAAVSRNGRYVAFASTATNLVRGGGFDGTMNVFLRDVQRGRTVLVSARPDGRPGDRWSAGPSIDRTGRFVTFDSDAREFLPSAEILNRGTYVRDVKSAVTWSLTGSVEFGSDSVEIAWNGRRAVYMWGGRIRCADVRPATNIVRIIYRPPR
ncbi:MAG: hypothetical protein IT198_16125 [Acidimicrobiia bacterium]|nr:hypothetical protein [Acidimicrobiia bacterium]